MNIEKYKAIIFDVDDTIAKRYKKELLSGVEEFFLQPTSQHYALFSNQGGVGLRYTLEKFKPEADTSYLPTPQSVMRRLYSIAKVLNIHKDDVLVSFAYVTATTNVWNAIPPFSHHKERWLHASRKPNPYLLHLFVEKYGYAKNEILFVGNKHTDEQLAKNYSCAYCNGDKFFNRSSERKNKG